VVLELEEVMWLLTGGNAPGKASRAILKDKRLRREGVWGSQD